MGVEREKAIRDLERIERNFELIRRVNYNPPSSTTNCLSGPAIAADFDQYHLPSARTHNLALHGFGIAVGLELSITAGRVNVSPGVAVDGDGQMIVLRKGGRFYFGESKTSGVGVAGVDLPPATNDGKPLRMSVTIEYSDDPRADDPASPICGMIEPMPWVRVLTYDDLVKIPNNGRLINLGDVEIDRESGARLLAGFRSTVRMNLSSVQLFRASSLGDKLYDICVGWLEASGSGISLVANDAYFGRDVRLMPWGDGSEVLTSGEAAVVIVGPDNKGILHIRVIDPFGNVICDTDEGRIPAAVDISAMKKQILAWMPPHVLVGDEKVQVLKWVYSLLPAFDFDAHPSVSIKGPTTIEGNTLQVSQIPRRFASGPAGEIPPGESIVERCWRPGSPAEVSLTLFG